MHNKTQIKIERYYSSQIGLMVSWGVNYERKPYIAIEIPFVTIQIFWFKNKRN